MVAQPLPHRNARLGMEVLRVVPRAQVFFGLLKQSPQRGYRAAQRSGHIKLVAGLRPGAQDGLVAWYGTEHDDVCQNPARRLSNVSADKIYLVFACESQQSVEKFIDPALRQLCGKRQRQKRRERIAAHGCDIAETASEAAVSDGVWRMPLAAKVNPFDAEVS